MHAKPTIEKKPENVIIHCGNNAISKDTDPEKIATDIISLSKSVSEKSGSNVIIFVLVPRKRYLNAKVRSINNRLRDYSRNRRLTFLKHNNIYAKTRCNISGLYLNSKEVPLFNENFASLLNTLDSENWHKHQNSEGDEAVNTKVSEDSVTTDNVTDCFTKVGVLHKKHLKNLFFGHLNINSLRNKIEFLEPLIRNHFDIFLVSEAKLDSNFLGSEFTIPGYRLFRKDRNQHGGSLTFFVNEDITCKAINTFNFANSLEVWPLKINLRNKKCLLLAAINSVT